MGISTCLLGERVRYDGGHKRDRYLTDVLGRYVEFIPVCPEQECGLPVPREAMQLVGDPGNPRLITVQTCIDHTERMVGFSMRKVRELEKEDLCGFIFKSRSPSSGMERIKVYDAKGVASNVGIGIFARIFMEHFPLLPVEDEEHLHDSGMRENFIERIFVMKRWRELLAAGCTRRDLVDFHTDHKLLLRSHSRERMREMGRLVSGISTIPPREAFDRYLEMLMKILALKTTVRMHTDVLQHILGHFKKLLSADEKQELLEMIESFRQEYAPLIVPVTLLNHYIRKYGIDYLQRQHYLNPHPIDLKLRNHA